VGAGERAVGIVMDKGRILVAYETAGVFSRQGWKGGWSRVDAASSDDPGPAGARRIVSSAPAGQMLLAADGTIFGLAAGGWERLETGLESAWVRELVVDAAGRPLALGVGGRPVALTLHEVLDRVTVASKHFSKSGTKVLPGAKGALGSALGRIASGKALARIEGYTDSSGTEKQNLALSLLRATTLAGWLVQQGASPGSVAAVGYGEEHFVASPASELNRRVVVVLLEP
jgi:outer membrane protein OmpA-like peptidoglycan-associated protein